MITSSRYLVVYSARVCSTSRFRFVDLFVDRCIFWLCKQLFRVHVMRSVNNTIQRLSFYSIFMIMGTTKKISKQRALITICGFSEAFHKSEQTKQIVVVRIKTVGNK